MPDNKAAAQSSTMAEAHHELHGVVVHVRSYNEHTDRAGFEELERTCQVGSSKHMSLFIDNLGDPLCRIRHSPIFIMLVAELRDINKLVGVIQGTIKTATITSPNHPSKMELAKIGYILGLRVSPRHLRSGTGSTLVHHLEQWFISHEVDYAYMATEKCNKPSLNLFVNKLGYLKFRKPSILVNPVNRFRAMHVPSRVKIQMLDVADAEFLYRKFMSYAAECFPADIDQVLKNKASLGTFVAYRKSESWPSNISGHQSGPYPGSWAMISVWNSSQFFKLKIVRASVSCMAYVEVSRLVDQFMPKCLNMNPVLDFTKPFGFYFMYGLHGEGPRCGELIRSLCNFVHNMAAKESAGQDCKVVVTEIGSCDKMKSHIPNWKILSCADDLWCIKSLQKGLNENVMAPARQSDHRKRYCKSIFVDPREV